MRFKITFILVFWGAVTGQASEVDHWTNRHLEHQESSKIFNLRAQLAFDEALIRANKKGHCDEERLYQSLRKQFNNHYKGKFVKNIFRKKSGIQTSKVKMKNSVYRDIWWGRMVRLNGGIWDMSGKLFKLNGVLLGSDKTDHFFGTGFRYYEKAFIDKEGVMAALRIGHNGEYGWLGKIPARIISFGDLTANFNGMRWWNSILQKYDDVLGPEYNNGPLVRCENGAWVRSGNIDIASYVDVAWDEAYNCSRFTKKRNLKNLLKRLGEKEIVYACPLIPDELENLKNKYGKYFPYIINSHGFNSLEDVLDPEWYPIP